MSEYFKQTDFLFIKNLVFIETLYKEYIKDPSSIDCSWVEFFEAQLNTCSIDTTSKLITNDNNSRRYDMNHLHSSESCLLKSKLMISDYRRYGHYLANLDPLGLQVNKKHNELKLGLKNFGFNNNELDQKVDLATEFKNTTICTVKELYNSLNTTYSGNIAAEFSHIENIDEQKWLYNQLENSISNLRLSDIQKKQVLQELTEVEIFEQYLHKKFPGAKRFSIEGGETTIVCLNKLVELLAISGVNEAVIGLTHRGRMSALTKVMKKPYYTVLSEFMENDIYHFDTKVPSGDVKYHSGFSSSKIINGNKKIDLSLCPNPSHLESINPVILGQIRAKQDRIRQNIQSVTGIIVHGDSAFCGQGVVSESFSMSSLPAYKVGGVFHLIINNQIGFTTDVNEYRSGRYCTEVAKINKAPILHVNGDDVESVIYATNIACNYKNAFKKDVVIDIICYRKYGHYESDDPMYTQSKMYNIIKSKKSTSEIYAEKLLNERVIDTTYSIKLKQEFEQYLDKELSQVHKNNETSKSQLSNKSDFVPKKVKKYKEFKTGINKSYIKELITSVCTIPDSFKANKKLLKLFKKRINYVVTENSIDWPAAEQLAFATLLQQEKVPIRITGQDTSRGTFSHRNAVLHSQIDESVYEPLNNISDNQAFFNISNSNLSEYGALGFEYGYSLVNSKHLVIWEAQFGDFCNGAQIIFDQFISSAETKWQTTSNIVCFLPNGMEGQGPEHSSARLERFLQLCANNNMQVVYPSTPASIFHLLRRQGISSLEKPLIIMSPKLLLRHKLAVSNISEIDEGTMFLTVLDEVDKEVKASLVKKIIFCSGKIYYDLITRRNEIDIFNIAIIRLEQLYPFPEEMIIKVLKKYNGVIEYAWVQEEPKNMGCWSYILSYMEAAFIKIGIYKQQLLTYVGRTESSSPAVGYVYLHNKEQKSLVDEALNIRSK